MHTVDMSLLTVNETYTAKQLAGLWGYKSHHALVKGVFHPKGTNILILFVTKKRQPGTTQFRNELRGNMIKIEGADQHGTDFLLQRNLETPTDQIYLFYREKHTLPFTFLGEVQLVRSWIHEDRSSEFEFFIEDYDSLEDDMALLDYIIHYNEDHSLRLDRICKAAEKLTYHLKCERDIDNRQRVLQRFGSACAICGFSYEKTYGKDLAKDYVEIHYLGDNDPSKEPCIDTDFIPICANCHRMLHYKRQHNLSVEELKNRVSYYGETTEYQQLSLPLDF